MLVHDPHIYSVPNLCEFVEMFVPQGRCESSVCMLLCVHGDRSVCVLTCGKCESSVIPDLFKTHYSQIITGRKTDPMTYQLHAYDG